MTSRKTGDMPHVECIVIDEDTVRFGGDEFKRVRTCYNISDLPEYEFKCSECFAVQDLRDEMGCLNLTLADRETEIPISYCPHCDARVL